MNREIKFRAWDNVGKCMLDWGCIVQTAFNRPIGKSDYGLMYRILTNQAEGNDNYGFVIMQFTGLKDKNGKEIYEGDILTLGGKYNYVVRFEGAKFVCYHTIDDYGRWGDLSRTHDSDFAEYPLTVIGNIYENQELLQNIHPSHGDNKETLPIQ